VKCLAIARRGARRPLPLRPAVAHLAAVCLAAVCLAVASLALASAAFAHDTQNDTPPRRQPDPYIPGRDVPWVPTPPVLIDKMLDMARLTPQDVVVDLGSGDGRTVIAAAKRGARARGVEFNPEMLALAKHNAAAAGVTATFTEGDMYEADISDATVLPLFLMTENLDLLAPKFLALRPGTRIVNNGFEFSFWDYDEIGHLDGEACGHWCVAYLYIVPARVAGVWRTDLGELELTQEFQWLTGTLTVKGERVPIERGRVQGDVIRFNVGTARYSGRVSGDAIAGLISGEMMLKWSGKR
jgi:SAM-dependent methyltransferase